MRLAALVALAIMTAAAAEAGTGSSRCPVGDTVFSTLPADLEMPRTAVAVDLLQGREGVLSLAARR
jgi:hypothetical protein